MKELLNKMQIMESEMAVAEQMSDYWTEEDHFDEEKAEKYEAEADEIYEHLYRLFEQAADRIVSITTGQIDKATAMTMIRCKRLEVERIFS